jgi:hypothetical protein
LMSAQNSVNMFPEWQKQPLGNRSEMFRKYLQKGIYNKQLRYLM